LVRSLFGRQKSDPALAWLACASHLAPMSDAATRLNAALEGRYRIERELGEGGMATVYLAQDLRHDRSVALKVLKPELAAVVGAERFLAEIKLTAGLQHPNILALYDSGEADSFLFYVMPHIAGESLRDRIDREKQLPVDSAVQLASSVAAALDYAHRQGIVHRDIKPENILLNDGQALVADFGIALAVRAAGGQRMTETGLSLGTPSYMSPEQVSADRDLDGRSDVYALGAMLYEMLAGRPPFHGASAQGVVAKILTQPAPSVTGERGTVPPHVDAAIRTALEKLPADRFETAEAFRAALADESYQTRSTTTGGVASAEPPAKSAPGFRSILPWILAAAFAVAAVVPRLMPDPPALVQRYSLSMEGRTYGGGPSLAISPDGSTIAYLGEGRQIYTRSVSSPEAQPVPASFASRSPFFSPDGRSVAFTVGPIADDQIRTVSFDGAPPRTLSGDHFPGGSWSDDGFVYYTDLYGVLFQVSEQGGSPKILADSRSGFRFHWPQALPGGRTLLVQVAPMDAGAFVATFDIQTGAVERLLEATYARYANGYLFWVSSEGTLFAQRFDEDALGLMGIGIELAENVQGSLSGSHEFAVADNGTLIYTEGGDGAQGGQSFAWVDRQGQVTRIDERLMVEFDDVDKVELSPDGRYVAFEVQENNANSEGDPSQIWIYDLEQNIMGRLTFQGNRNTNPQWLSDGRTLAYLSNQGDGPMAIWSQPFDRSGTDRLLLQTDVPIMDFNAPASDDLPFVLMVRNDVGSLNDLYTAWPGSSQIDSFLVTRFGESRPRISPDGRWVVYQSNESGRTEIYVRSFPRGGRPWPISRAGGRYPAWSRSGDEIFYQSSATNSLLSARLELDDELQIVSTTSLFETYGLELGGTSQGSTWYSVAEGDDRFLVTLLDGLGGDAGETVLVLNVFEELRARLGN
jgi:eukaryotic-like serine/threonine-protein kinase